MKKLYTTALVILTAHLTFANPVIKSTDGNWKNTSTWSLNRLPASSNSIYVHFSEQVKESEVVRLISTIGQVVSQKTFDESVGKLQWQLKMQSKEFTLLQ